MLRTLREAYPDADITASDVNRDGVDFCASMFGASKLYSDTNPAAIELPRGFDLIWVGSVFTHVDKKAWTELLDLFRDSLARDGVLVFSTHGPDVERKIRTGEMSYALYGHTKSVFLADLAATGFA